MAVMARTVVLWFDALWRQRLLLLLNRRVMVWHALNTAVHKPLLRPPTGCLPPNFLLTRGRRQIGKTHPPFCSGRP